MEPTNGLTATIEVKRRSLPSALVMLPRVFWRHYRLLRRTQGRLTSICGAWMLARLVVTVRRRRKKRWL